jgi:hypothetical protein
MKKILTMMLTMLLLFSLTACSAAQSISDNAAAQLSQASSYSAASALTQDTPVTGAASVPEALSQNGETHENSEDYVWESSSVIPILLNGNSISSEGAGVTVDGDQVTINAAGTYSLSGTLVDGQIIVNTEEKEIVRLILNGVVISNSTSSAIHILNAKEAHIVLADGTHNYLSDATEYVIKDSETDEPNAAIFSMSDLSIYGDGSLTVTGNFNDGIASKAGLIIAGGEITVQAVDDGLRGKDYLVIKGGTITVDAQGDGLKSDNAEDAAKGYISIEAGQIHITAGGDAVEAETDVAIAGGNITLIAGGGSNALRDENISGKGIKAAISVNIDGGTFDIHSADDALHSNGSLNINGGTFIIATGDDGLHADDALTINGGEMRITQSFEGLESAVITINAGIIHIVSSDDAINVAGGVDGSGMNAGMGTGGRQRPGGGPGQDFFTATGNYYLYINGGYIVLDAGGDGLDVNGAAEMTGGIVLLNGPTENMNGALDYYTTFNISGGTLVAVGSAGMAQAPSETSSQFSLMVNLDGAQRAGTLIHIQSADGEDTLTFSPRKSYQSIVISSPDLEKSTNYEIYLGGSSTGTETDGLVQGGSYSSGTKLASLSISGVVTYVGDYRGGFGGRQMPGGGQP